MSTVTRIPLPKIHRVISVCLRDSDFRKPRQCRPEHNGKLVYEAEQFASKYIEATVRAGPDSTQHSLLSASDNHPLNPSPAKPSSSYSFPVTPSNGTCPPNLTHSFSLLLASNLPAKTSTSTSPNAILGTSAPESSTATQLRFCCRYSSTLCLYASAPSPSSGGTRKRTARRIGTCARERVLLAACLAHSAQRMAPPFAPLRMGDEKVCTLPMRSPARVKRMV